MATTKKAEKIPVDDLRLGHSLFHADSGREVLRVSNDNPRWRSVLVIYDPDGKWAGGRTEPLTDALMASYGDMDLMLEYEEPEAWQLPGGPSWYEWTYGAKEPVS